jgi:hypothetical protein
MKELNNPFVTRINSKDKLILEISQEDHPIKELISGIILI